jgi:predicted metal-binding membrane protein
MVELRTPISAASATRAVTVTGVLALAAGCWLATVHQMAGMDMGTATELGSFPSFIAVWVPMMAAMMLPGAAPALWRRMRVQRRVLPFLATYIIVWASVGVVVYAVYRPHGSVAAGAVLLAAGAYELTPVKARCRTRCRAATGAGEFALCCVGSSAALMAAFVALGVMSVAWMLVAAAVALAQKLLAATPVIDAPVALSIAGFGLFTVLTH